MKVLWKESKQIGKSLRGNQMSGSDQTRIFKKHNTYRELKEKNWKHESGKSIMKKQLKIKSARWNNIVSALSDIPYYCFMDMVYQTEYPWKTNY